MSEEVKDVMDLAQECGGIVSIWANRNGSFIEFNDKEIADFAERIRLAERERCAKVCDALHDKQLNSMTEHNYHRFAAAAIRKG